MQEQFRKVHDELVNGSTPCCVLSRTIEAVTEITCLLLKFLRILVDVYLC
jgi:hypothetical protein